MTLQRWTTFFIFVAFSAATFGLLASARAADDTARFYGQWKATIPANGQSVTIVSVHDANGFKNYLILPNGSMPFGNGTFAAADGKYSITSPFGNDAGTYQFTDDNTVVCKNAMGQMSTWTRDNTPLPGVSGHQPMPAPAAVAPPAAVTPPPPANAVDPQLRADILAKIQARDFDGATLLLNQHGAPMSPDPFLCVTHADMMLQMENYRQARAEMTFFMQHTFDCADAYVAHAKACAAMGDTRWADQDLRTAAQLRPATADADRQAVAPYAAIDPPGFAAAELPGQLDELVKMSGRNEPFASLAQQAMRIVKGEYNIRRVEADEYRERKRQLIAAAVADPTHAQPLADLASFLYEQSSAIHGDGREGVGIMAYRFIEPTKERQAAIACADGALRIDPTNAEALSVKAGALIALGDDDDARPLLDQALSLHPNEPELLRMFSQLMTRSAWNNSDAADQLATPLMWEDDQYYYTQQRSPEDLAKARSFNAAAGDERDKAASALQASVDNTRGTAAGFYYQAVQFHRNREQDANAEASAAAAMEQAVKLAPNDVGYRDFLAELYSHMGWRWETAFFTQWSIADNLGETSAAKMDRLAYKQIRRTEFDAARQSLAEAMRIDPADPRAPAYMGLLIAGENHDRAQVDQSASWLLAACALEEANLRLWGLRHPTPSIFTRPIRSVLKKDW